MKDEVCFAGSFKYAFKLYKVIFFCIRHGSDAGTLPANNSLQICLKVYNSILFQKLLGKCGFIIQECLQVYMFIYSQAYYKTRRLKV